MCMTVCICANRIRIKHFHCSLMEYIFTEKIKSLPCMCTFTQPLMGKAFKCLQTQLFLCSHPWMQISIKALYGYVNGDVSESIHSTSVLIIGQKFISIMHL